MALLALLSPSPPPVAAAAWRAPAPTRACSARSAPAAAGRVIAHGKPPVVILPGFLKGDELYSEMADTLRARGHPAVVVARVSQWQWYPTLAGADFGWYLDAVDAAVADAESKAPGCGGVALVGHSAGGWLARAYLCRERYCGVSYGERAAGRVACVLTLGSPHTNLEAYPLGRATERRRGERADMPEAAAGSSLAWTNTYAASTRIPSESLVQRLYAPGCALASEGVKYYTVVGTGVVGAASPLERGADAFAAFSYEATCGRSKGIDGDGVTPVESAGLEGAPMLLLPGVRHLPAKGVEWYGSEGGVSQWAHLLDGGDACS